MKTPFVNGLHGDVCPKDILSMINNLIPSQSLEKDILIKTISSHIKELNELAAESVKKLGESYEKEIEQLKKEAQERSSR